MKAATACASILLLLMLTILATPANSSSISPEAKPPGQGALPGTLLTPLR